MSGYTHTTFSQLKTALANRLSDTGAVYWVNGSAGAVGDELGRYIIEALRTWGLLTYYWRDRGIFNTAANTAFYDISTLRNTSASQILSYAVADNGVTADIQSHLLEPSTGTTWTGSEQFTLTDVTDALTRRRNQVLIETGAVVTHTTQFLAPSSLSFDLPDTTLAIRRAAWTGAITGTTWPLYPEDISSQRNYGTAFLNTPGTPTTYSSASMQPLRYLLAPPPSEPGTLDLLLVQSGTALTAQGIAIGLPDDMTPIVKWGAMADMLGKEGPGQDLARSYFCERRYKLLVEAAKSYPTVINAQINGIDLSPDAIDRLDMYNLNWQSSTGVPDMIGSLRNIVALSKCPGGVYSVLLDVVAKAVIPTAEGDFIQVGREYLDPILDYAEHLAAFKCGGMEFRHTYRAADNFFQAALKYNQRLAAQTPAIRELIRQSVEDDSILRRERQVDDRPLQQTAQISDQAAQLKQLYTGN